MKHRNMQDKTRKSNVRGKGSHEDGNMQQVEGNSSEWSRARAPQQC